MSCEMSWCVIRDPLFSSLWWLVEVQSPGCSRWKVSQFIMDISEEIKACQNGLWTVFWDARPNFHTCLASYLQGTMQDVQILAMPQGYISQCPDLNRSKCAAKATGYHFIMYHIWYQICMLNLCVICFQPVQHAMTFTDLCRKSWNCKTF